MSKSTKSSRMVRTKQVRTEQEVSVRSRLTTRFGYAFDCPLDLSMPVCYDDRSDVGDHTRHGTTSVLGN